MEGGSIMAEPRDLGRGMQQRFARQQVRRDMLQGIDTPASRIVFGGDVLLDDEPPVPDPPAPPAPPDPDDDEPMPQASPQASPAPPDSDDEPLAPFPDKEDTDWDPRRRR